ncbi:MAG: helix-hairpin-helix domain-containing protein [Planctomycetota bacterium]
MPGRAGLASVLAVGLLLVLLGLAWALACRDTAVASVQTQATGYRMPVNSATRGELRALPGIGRVNAGYLVTHRDQHGRFDDAQSLTEVRMIGRKTADAVERWVVFD